jgi:hypothetical protein
LLEEAERMAAEIRAEGGDARGDGKAVVVKGAGRRQQLMGISPPTN